MCGLVGMMGDFQMRHKDMMFDLLYLDTLRGKDSTGVAAIRAGGNTADWYKSTVPGYEYIEQNKAKDLLRLNDVAWIGHNRFGTVGKNIRQNAHPFCVWDDEEKCWLIIGAHNGTLKNKIEFDKNNDFGTDSEAFLNAIGKTDAKSAIARAEGAWALTWYDGAEEQLNMIRNEERPLYFCYTEDRKVLIWASESWMIRAAAGRRDVKLAAEMFCCNKDTLYTFDAPNRKINEGKIGEATVTKEVCGKPAPTFQQAWDYGDGWRRAGSSYDSDRGVGRWVTENGIRRWVEGAASQQPAKKEAGKEGEERETFVALKADEVRGYDGKPIKRTMLEEMKGFGCDWCQDKIPSGAPFSFLAEDALLCHNCNFGKHYSGGSLLLTAKQKEELIRLRDQKLLANKVRNA